MSPSVNQYGPHTTQQDIDAIKNFFGNNYEAIDKALETGVTGNFAVEDLIVARYELSGELPEFMVSAEGEIPSPEEAPWLWEDNQIDTYKYWQQNDDNLKTAMNKLLTQVPVTYEDILAGAEDIENIPGAESSDVESGSAVKAGETANNGWNLANYNDFKDFVGSQVDSGNLSGAVTSFAVFQMGPQANNLYEEALYKLEEAPDHINELLDEMSSLDRDADSYQADLQRLQIQVSNIQEGNKALQNIIESVQNMQMSMLEFASALERTQRQTISSIIGNI